MSAETDIGPAGASVPSHVPADHVIDWDFYTDPALSADVHARIREVRDASPAVAWSVRNGGHWLIFGRKELHQVMGDPATFSSRQLSLQPTPDNERTLMIPIQLDPPHNTPYRHMLLKYLGPKEVREMEPFVRGWAERLIGKLEGRAECDFVKEVSEPMPVSVFMETMGLPLERFDEFRGLAVAALNPHTPAEERPVLHGRIIAVLAELIEARRQAPRDDLVSHLLAEEIDGRKLSQEEMFSLCYLLFLAGLDTVTNAMGYGMRHLALDPQLQAQIAADPAIIPEVVEELLRRYTFIVTFRLATRDAEVGDITIKAGEPVACVLWGGSNDESAEAAEESARQYAFGHGVHTCLGMHLARLELRVMYETWFKHVGRFRLGPQTPGAMHGGSVMGISSLPLILEPVRKPVAA